MFGWKVAPGVVAAAAAALAVSVSAWPCAGVAAPNLKDMIFGNKSEKPRVAKYATEDGLRFVMDRSNGVTLLKFDDSSEVWVLSPSYAPRGDIIYRDDVGQPAVRMTKLGGMVVYMRNDARGVPAAFLGQATQIRMQAFNAQALLQRLAQASVRASRSAGRLIIFDAPDVTVGSEAVYADAAALAAEAVAAIAQRRGKKQAQKIERVELVQNGHVDAKMNGRTLVVSLTPKKGVAGRPSSRRIMAAASH